eukprot:Partr_v1_DN23368_c0_g1_i1_m18251 putative B9 protein domain 1
MPSTTSISARIGRCCMYVQSSPVDTCGFNSYGCMTSKGHTEGITQISQPKGGVGVWNFPIDCSFKSTNAHGWPQLIVTVYGTDFLGRDIVRGYGSIHLPMIHGRSLLYIDLFAPMPSSGLTSLLGFIVGRPPEFLDPKLVTKSDGRQVTRVESDGCVKCVVDCTQKDFDKYFD